MKTKLLTTILAAGMLSGCSSAFYLSSTDPGADDVYYNPNKVYIAQNQEKEIKPVNATDPKIAALQEKINSSLADTSSAIDTVYVDKSNPYDNILAHNYLEARQRRDSAAADPAFNYSEFEDALWYANAYDPLFYNVIVYGSHVWVEPKYLASSWYYRPVGWTFGFGYGSNLLFGFGYDPMFYPSSYFSYFGGYGGFLGGFGYYNYFDPYYGSGFDWYYNSTYNSHHNGYFYGQRNSFGSASALNASVSRIDNGGTMLRRNVSTSTRQPSGDMNATRITRGQTAAASTDAAATPTYRRRSATDSRTPYTRPVSNVNQTTSNNTNGYTPTYTRPSNGLRQNFNSNRPSSSTPGNYYRRPTSSGNSSNTYRRSSTNGGFSNSTSRSSGSSNSSGSGFSSGRSSGSSNTSNTNSGSAGGTRRR